MKHICSFRRMMPHYRTAIYRKMEEAFPCDWYYGENRTTIKEMDVSVLQRVKECRIIGNPDKVYWLCGMVTQLFKGYDTYLITAETRNLAAWVFVFLSRFFPGKRVYSWTHGWYGREPKWIGRGKVWFFRQLTGSFLYGNYAKEQLVAHGIEAQKLFVIHNSLDYDSQLSIRQGLAPTPVYRNHFGNSRPTIIFIGRLTESKRLDMLIDAVATLSEHGEKYNVVVVGDGAPREALRQRAAERGVAESIWFYGACYDEAENARLIYNAHLCVSPGNVGLTAIHTMVFGTPVITHDDFPYQGPEFEAITPGLTGDFFRRGDVGSLVERIHSWFASHPDREATRQACYHEIGHYWTPEYQLEVLKRHMK